MPIGGGGFGEGGFGEQGFGAPPPPPPGVVTFVQGASAGPAPNSNFSVQFASNVASGDLLIVKVWAASQASVSVSVSDNQGNTYSLDVAASAASAVSSPKLVRTEIWSAIANSSGVRPTISVSISATVVLAGAAIAEYAFPFASPLDTTATGSDDGTAGVATAVLTPGHANELVIGIGAGYDGVFSGLNWTTRDTWTSGSYDASGVDQSFATTGFSATAYETNSNIVSCIALAAYRMSTAVIYNESISLGVQAGTNPSVGVIFATSVALGLLGGTADSVASQITDSVALGALAGTLDSLSVRIQQALALGIQAGTAADVSATLSGVLTIGALAATISAVQATISSTITLGSQDGTSATPRVTIQDSAHLGVQAGTQADVSNLIAAAIACGVIEGIVAVSGGSSVYSDSIGLGVSAATQVAAAVGAQVALSLGTLAGSGATPSVSFRDSAAIAALFQAQAAVFLEAAAQIGIGIGLHVGASPTVVFTDQVALAAFAAVLARYISPATIRLLIVPFLQRSFVAHANATILHVPPLERSFIAIEDVMLYAFKHPASTEDFTFDLSSLAIGTTINSITVPPVAGLAITIQPATLPLAKIRIGGGVAGQRYFVSIEVNLESEEIKAFTLMLIVQPTTLPCLKDPNSTENFHVDWIPELDGDTVQSGAWPPSPPGGLAISNETNDALSSSAWIGGGAVGKYTLTNTITTAGGQVKACDLVMMVTPQ